MARKWLAPSRCTFPRALRRSEQNPVTSVVPGGVWLFFSKHQQGPGNRAFISRVLVVKRRAKSERVHF